MATIVRAPRPVRPWADLPVATLRDRRLSYRARGVLARLPTNEDGYPMSSVELAREGREGRDAIRAALRELERCGYLIRSRVQDPRGRWSTLLVVHETPQVADSRTPAAAPATSAAPEGVNEMLARLTAPRQRHAQRLIRQLQPECRDPVLAAAARAADPVAYLTRVVADTDPRPLADLARPGESWADAAGRLRHQRTRPAPTEESPFPTAQPASAGAHSAPDHRELGRHRLAELRESMPFLRRRSAAQESADPPTT